MPIRIRKLGRIFKGYSILQRERTPAWAVALALLLYPAGVSLRRISTYLSLHRVHRAHTAIWYWLQRAGERLLPWQGPLPRRIVVDETWVQVGGTVGSSQLSILRPEGSSMLSPAGSGAAGW